MYRTQSLSRLGCNKQELKAEQEGLLPRPRGPTARNFHSQSIQPSSSSLLRRRIIFQAGSERTAVPPPLGHGPPHWRGRPGGGARRQGRVRGDARREPPLTKRNNRELDEHWGWVGGVFSARKTRRPANCSWIFGTPMKNGSPVRSREFLCRHGGKQRRERACARASARLLVEYCSVIRRNGA